MAKFSYVLRGDGKENSKQTVIVRFTHNREHFPRTTKVKVLAKDFDATSGKVKPKVADAFEANAAIELVRSRIERALDRVKKRNLEPTKSNVAAAYTTLMEQAASLASVEGVEILNDVEQDLRNAILKLEAQLAIKQTELKEYLDLKNGTSYSLFYNLINEYGKTKKTDNTKQNYTVTSNLIKLYYPNLIIDEVDAKILVKLRDDLIKADLRNSTINEHFIRLKAAIKHYAEQDEYKEKIDIRFLDKVKVDAAIDDKPVIYLEPTELEAIERLELAKPRQQYIRDMFLLSCYTGLRHVDLHVTKANVQNGYLQFLASKTSKQVLVPFQKKAIKIMARMEAIGYEYEPQMVGNYSAEVKAICKQVIELQHNVVSNLLPAAKGKPVPTAPKYSLISSKVGRKTFINNCLLRNVKIEIVASWVGHAKLDMIQNHYSNKLAQSNAELYKLEDDE